MKAKRPDLAERFTTVVRFLTLNPLMLPGSTAKKPVGSEEHFSALARRYVQAREPKLPKPPSTVPDPLVSFILHVYFNLDEASLDRAQKEHQWSMAAENMVGDLLERYLASVLEPEGWVWCAGSVVKSVDFIIPRDEKSGEWVALQIKNRDNSENSSSRAVRDGTAIAHWFRTFSRTGNTNWSAFPDPALREQLSEDGFRTFASEYLNALK